jgi:MFS family permease
LVALALMRAADFTPLRTVERERGQMRAGFRYVFTDPLLRSTVLAVAVVGTFAFNYTVTFPTFSRVTFHQSSATLYGLFMAAMGLGAIIGSLYIAHRSNPTPGLLAVLGVGFGLTMTAAALAPRPWIALVSLVGTGAFSIAFVSSANATLQMHSSEQMRGRVMSLHGTAVLGTTPIGAPLVGYIVRTTNPRVGLLVGSLLTLVTGVVLSVRWLAQRDGVAPRAN